MSADSWVQFPLSQENSTPAGHDCPCGTDSAVQNVLVPPCGVEPQEAPAGAETDEESVRASVADESGFLTKPSAAGLPFDSEAERSAEEGAGKFPATTAAPVSGRIPATWRNETARALPEAEPAGTSAAPAESADLSKAAEASGKSAEGRIAGRNADARRESRESPDVRNFAGSSFSRSQRGTPAV